LILQRPGKSEALGHNIGVDDNGMTAQADRVEDLQARIRLLEDQLREARGARPEAELRQQWRTFDTALSHNLDFNYIFDLQGRFTYVNRALLSLWKKPLEEAVGKNFFDLQYPDELAARLQRQIQQVIDTRANLRDQTPYVGAAGETGYYEYTFVPVIGETGKVEAVAGSTRDITDHVRMKEALALSEHKLQQVFSQAPVAIVVLRGPEYVVEMANPSYCAMVNRDLVGQRFEEVLPELGSDVWEAFRKVMETGLPFVKNEFHVPYDQNKDGVPEDHWFNVVYHPLCEADGAVSGLAAVCSEVTTQVIARKELERANRELEEFAYVASHDLQEPLRTVSIYTKLLLERYIPEDPVAGEYVGFVRQAVGRMAELIKDLLIYSKVVHENDTEWGTADLNESLSQALKVMEGRIGEAGAELVVTTLPTVRGEASQLAHVFQNLLSNSLKYRRADVAPRIFISAKRSGQDWIVAVEDNGIGFEPEYSQRIFGLFKRLHKDEYPGTGLGLAICQRIVGRYGGRMWAEGRPGFGATFYISLPGCEAA